MLLVRARLGVVADLGMVQALVSAGLREWADDVTHGPAAPRCTADAVGGNSLTLVIGCIKQGDWELSKVGQLLAQ